VSVIGIWMELSRMGRKGVLGALFWKIIRLDLEGEMRKPF